MRRNLLLLAVMAVAVLFFSSQTFGQCPEEANDLGICDTVYFHTCAGSETYEATPGGYDSVSLGIFVTHDSNTFWWESESKWVQDSIAAFVIPLDFSSVGCADSVIVPFGLPDNWNNTALSPYDPRFARSIFRDGCDGQANRMGWLAAQFQGLEWATIILDIENTPTQHIWLSMIPSAPSNRRWWEGSHVLLATLDFHMYMEDPCDTSEICIDSGFWPPASHLTFTRHDAVVYYPRHFLPVCDTIYIVPCLAPNITCPDAETQGCSGTYTTATTFDADDGNPGDDEVEIIALQVVTTTGCVTGATLVNVTYGAGDKTATGDISYTVDHCANGSGTVTLRVTNNCAPPKTADCTFNVTCTNLPPQITCPGNVTGPYDITLVSGDFVATDECAGVVPTVAITNVTPTPTNAPAIVGSHVEWVGFCDETITITLEAADDCSAKATCQFSMTSTNSAPVITCPADLEQYWSVGDPPIKSGDFSIADGEGGPFTVTVSAATVNPPAVVGSHVEWEPDETEFCTPIEFTLTAMDTCQATGQCTFTMHAKEITGYVNGVIIPNKVYERFGFGHWDYFEPENYILFDDKCPPYHGISPGDFFEIPVILQGFGAASPESAFVGGFELELEFDYIDMTFYGAERGGLLSARWLESYEPNPTDSVLWSWEYFAYRVLPCPLCACCKYKILLYGQAEMPDGHLRRGYMLGEKFPDGTPEHAFWYVDETQGGEKIGATLVWLKFQVANNELLRDLKLPIFFEWEHKEMYIDDEWVIVQDWDCAENTMSDPTGEILFVSDTSSEYATGSSDLCPANADILQILTFVDGGVHICSPCTSFHCVRGDINVNDIAYETADAVLFARYFVYGLSVFTDPNRDGQICASDVNADGRTLMLADLIYLIRVIQRDAVPFGKLGPSADVANLIVSDGRISVESASEIGGLLFEFDAAVTPSLLADMELIANEGKVLVWSSDGKSIEAGISDVMTFAGAELVSVTAVDREGRDLETTITAKVAPSAFALYPAYPNPFNPYTTMSFSLPNAAAYRLNIYNVAGQLVRSYEGMGVAGLNAITWDGMDKAGSDVSSGVYFFTVMAGPHKATAKMVLMK